MSSEFEKCQNVSVELDAIHEFLEWLESNGKYISGHVDSRDLMYESLGIDPDKLEEERQELLKELRGLSNGPGTV